MIVSAASSQEKLEPREQPAFRDGQILRAEDLRREDQYRHRAMREHQANAHSAGIVSGLWLEPDEEGKIRLAPGMAIDGRGRTILVPEEQPIEHCPLAEVWIAFKECPADGEDRNTPDRPPNRYVPGFEILYGEAGGCPEEASEGVYLGNVYDPDIKMDFMPRSAEAAADSQRSEAESDDKPWGFSLFGRRYVAAVGGRIEAASRTSRILLGPEKPLDSRLFAIGSRADVNQPYRDHITVEAGGILHFHSPTRMGLAIAETSGPASLELGYRDLEFRTSDLPSANHLAAKILNSLEDWIQPLFPLEDAQRKIAQEFIRRPSLSECECEVIARILCAWLNNVIRDTGEKKSQVPVFFEAAYQRRNTLDLREETRSLLGGEHRARHPDLLMRLLLEDLFHPHLRQTDVSAWQKSVLEFRGAKPLAETPRPGQLYLARIETDEGPHEELRLELHHPGPGNNPERFKALVRVPEKEKPKTDGEAIPKTDGEAENPEEPITLDYCLSVDSSGTVVVNVLKVFPKDEALEPGEVALGLILLIDDGEREKEAARLKAEQLELVAPWDLVMSGMTVERDPVAQALKLKGVLTNTGKGDMIGIQLHTQVTLAGFPNAPPVSRKTVIRELVLKAGESKDYNPIPLEIPIGNPDDYKKQLDVFLYVLGAGPGGIVAQEQQTIVIPAVPSS